MPYVLCYTKKGEGKYPDYNYPGNIAFMCDWEQSMHLAISDDGVHFEPLRNNTGVLFAKCTYDEGNPKGVTKTITDPWLFRDKAGRVMVCAVRRNQNSPDSQNAGCAMLFSTADLVRFEEIGFIKLAESEIRHPEICYNADIEKYQVRYQYNGIQFYCETADFHLLENVRQIETEDENTDDYGITGAIYGNVLEISEAEANTIRKYLGKIYNVAVEKMEYTVPVNTKLTENMLPKAKCVYNDGSYHEKNVKWRSEDIAGINTSKLGNYTLRGTIQQECYDFPFELNFGVHKSDEINDPAMDKGMSDPCITYYKGKYYLSSSGNQNIVLRCADKPEDVFSAPPNVIYRVSPEIIYHAPGEPINEEAEKKYTGTWAAELHEIDGVLYMFTAICPGGEWTRVKSVVLKCNGNPLEESSWETPRYCVKPDGSILTEGGISLDMTYFRDGEKDYVMWSDRKIRYGTSPLIVEPADIYIAEVDPKAPWQLLSNPVCVIRPTYGWDRMETEVVEGPYLLRHGNDLFVTISGSSTGMADLYDVGLLRAKVGSDLLIPSSWDYLSYPILTKESVKGEFGPGHNNFVKSPASGDDIMVYHAVPHDENGKTLHRHPGMRRVHYASTGLPYLEMTREMDLRHDLADVVLHITVKR